jgi:hypothetical protein
VNEADLVGAEVDGHEAKCRAALTARSKPPDLERWLAHGDGNDGGCDDLSTDPSAGAHAQCTSSCQGSGRTEPEAGPPIVGDAGVVVSKVEIGTGR